MTKITNLASVFQQEIDDTMFSISLDQILMDKLHPTDLKIATITVGVTSSIKINSLCRLDDDFVQKMKSDTSFTFESLSGHGDCLTKWTNSRILRLTYNGAKKYIIIFCNGSFQIAGCKEVTDASYLVARIFMHLGVPVNDNDLLCDVRMFNSTFKVGRCVKLHEFHELISKQYTSSTFSPDTGSSGVNVPIYVNDKKVAIVVYPKGSIVMTGANAISQLHHCYNVITSFLDLNYDLLTYELVEEIKVPKKRGRKRKCETSEFYNSLDI